MENRNRRIQVLQATSDAFTVAATVASGKSEDECCKAMESLCGKTGRILYDLISKAVITFDGLPKKLKEPPTMVGMCPPDGHWGTIEVPDCFWQAFIGWANNQGDLPIATAEGFMRKAFDRYEPGMESDEWEEFFLRHEDVKPIWPQVCQASIQAIEYLIQCINSGVETTSEAATQSPPAKQGTQINNPSTPVTIKEAASTWGITQKKLRGLMKSGRVPHEKLGRQTFIFSRDQIPGLPAPKMA